MLGAIAGDLAAWTYENDKERFYSSLTSPAAVLSSLGKAALDAAVFSLDRKEDQTIDYAVKHECLPLRHADRLIQCATLAWSGVPFSVFKGDTGLFYDDKEGMYAGRIIAEIIPSLLQGKTKTEVLAEGMGEVFSQLKSTWEWKVVTPKDGLLTYLMRAWDCFEKAWDFTSAIHNAARWENVDRHLLCSLTGAISEAMYGCEYRLLKKKYGGNWYSYIEYPADIKAAVQRIHDFQFRNRVFFPKNSALTNVEKQEWSDYPSKLEGMAISEEQRKAILKAFYTGWDDRYGLYLDNGWVYTYRSEVLIARFRIVPADKGYAIVNLQRSKEKPDLTETAVQDALYSAQKFNC